MKYINVTYICPQCEHEFQLGVTPIIPARTYGPPEHCHPAEGGEPDLDECPKCKAEIDMTYVYDLLDERIKADECDDADFRREDER